MAKAKQMVAISASENPVNVTDKYHAGLSAALTVRGVEVILTAKSGGELNYLAKKIMGSQSFNLDFSICKRTAVFGVIA
jgi:hypothetical protein